MSKSNYLPDNHPCHGCNCLKLSLFGGESYCQYDHVGCSRWEQWLSILSKIKETRDAEDALTQKQ
jgi:hypothetical protein